jgi:hypothetical protein
MILPDMIFLSPHDFVYAPARAANLHFYGANRCLQKPTLNGRAGSRPCTTSDGPAEAMTARFCMSMTTAPPVRGYDRIQVMKTTLIPRIMSLSVLLALRRTEFHWAFMSREALLKAKLVLRIARSGETNEHVIFKGGQMRESWEPMKFPVPQAGEVYFGFKSSVKYPTALSDRLEGTCGLPARKAGSRQNRPINYNKCVKVCRRQMMPPKSSRGNGVVSILLTIWVPCVLPAKQIRRRFPIWYGRAAARSLKSRSECKCPGVNREPALSCGWAEPHLLPRSFTSGVQRDRASKERVLLSSSSSAGSRSSPTWASARGRPPREFSVRDFGAGLELDEQRVEVGIGI